MVGRQLPSDASSTSGEFVASEPGSQTRPSHDDLVHIKVNEFSTRLANYPLADGVANWHAITSRVLEREAVVKLVKGNLERDDGLSSLVSYEIASTDIFVQKAETDLNARSERMKNWAKYSGISSIVPIPIYALLIYYDALEISGSNLYLFIASLIRSVVITGVFLGFIYLMVSLFRAFLHEWTILENRAHSLRLGRLYIYLKYASLTYETEVSKIREQLTAADLERVFGWNIETSTAFKDIKPEFVSRNLISQVIDGASRAFSRKSS